MLWSVLFVAGRSREVCEPNSKCRGARPYDEAVLKSHSRGSSEVEGKEDRHAWAHRQRTFPKAAMRIKPPDGARSESVLVV